MTTHTLFSQKKNHCMIFIMILIALTTSCKEKEVIPGKDIALTKIDSTQLTYLLPSPQTKGITSVEEALSHRRSHRHYQERKITVEQISQILWAAYGITMPRTDYFFLRGGLRTAPSAGALYPLELYVLVGNVKDIEPGMYRYIAKEHKIVRIIEKDIKKDLSVAALNQEMISIAPACLFYSAIFSRTTEKYGGRGRERYVCMDLGHSAQNVYLQAEALNLGTCAIGAFKDDEVRKVMQLPHEEEPLYIMPIGHYYDR